MENQPERQNNPEKENKKSSTRKKVGAVVVGAMLTGAAVFGWQAKDRLDDFRADMLRDDGNITAESALNKVEISGDVRLVEAEGSAGATIEKRMKSFGIALPGTMQRASVEIESGLDVMAEQEALSLEINQDEDDGIHQEQHLDVTVNTDELFMQTSETKNVETTGDKGLFGQLGDIVNLGDKNETEISSASNVATNNLKATCSDSLSDAIAPAAASWARHNLEQTAQMLEKTEPEVSETLDNLSKDSIHVKLQDGSGQEVAADKIQLGDAEAIDSKTIEREISSNQTLEVTLTAGSEKCEVSEEAHKDITETQLGENYSLN